MERSKANIERVARAICAADGDHWFASDNLVKHNERHVRLARAAIESMPASQEVGELAGLVDRIVEAVDRTLASATRIDPGLRHDVATDIRREAVATLTSLMQENERMREALRSARNLARSLGGFTEQQRKKLSDLLDVLDEALKG